MESQGSRMENMSARLGVTEREGGFALILALMALLLLTFLGLSLAALTSTELQISTNYRWSQQALYNAEAGTEIGKALLRDMNWSLIMPQARQNLVSTTPPCTDGDPSTTLRCWWPYPDNSGNPATPPQVPTIAPYSRPDPNGNASRNFEGSPCDNRGNGMGYGVVLDDGGGFGPYQNVSTIQGQTINGTFTLWIRRPYKQNPDGSYSDGLGDPDTELVLVAEGTAPYLASANNDIQTANRAVRTVELTLTRTLDTECGTRGGQVGGGPEGSNFSPCDPVTKFQGKADLGVN